MCPLSVGTSRSPRALETGEAKLWVLLVGVNHYDDPKFPQLAYPALDCQGLGEAIAAATQTFPKKTLILHHDHGIVQGSGSKGSGQTRRVSEAIAATGRLSLTTHSHLRGLHSQSPQLATVRTSLQQVVDQAQAQDTVLFYFSGHGVLSPEHQQAVLCLADTQRDQLEQTGLGLQDLLALLGKCAARQQLVWLDACHSGGLSFRVAKSEVDTEPLPNPTLQMVEVLRRRAAQSKGFYALLSCDQDQQSWEFPELGHGVFTYYLMRGLLGDAADAQGVIEIDTLYKYVYYQTLQYIDKTNQQLRLINQQKRGRGDTQLQPEYPLQTPKRIVEGVGELIVGVRPRQQARIYPRQAMVVAGLGSSQTSLALSKALRGAGGFELTYFPQKGKDWTGLRDAMQACLQSGETGGSVSTVLLYLRGRVAQSDSGDAVLEVKAGVTLSRSWLRRELRKSPAAQQIVILDCPEAEPEAANLAEWVEDLQVDPELGQCLIAAASSDELPEQFAQILLDGLTIPDDQTGLSAAGWIANLQGPLAEAGITPHLWLSGSQGVIEVLPSRTATPGVDSGQFDLGLCPYRGLLAFGEDDAPFFFGRESLTQQLINTLMTTSFLAVVGASGSGKSSVVQAGLIAQLRQGKRVPGSDDWWMRSLRPGSRPLDALATNLVDAGTEREQSLQKSQLEGILYQGVESFVYWLRSRPEPMLVLVLDQFEELFTLSPVEDRQRFIDLILGAISHAGDRFKLVITLRTDFIAPCLEHPDLAAHIQTSSLFVPPTLSPEDYRQIITRPADKVGLKVQPELVEVLLDELSAGSGDLPLLEFVLEQIWEHRQPGKLTLQTYQQAIGGLKGALERKAQAVYENLSSQEQDCARWIFLSLTQLGEGSETTRRRIAKADLVVKKYPAELVERTLQVLTAAKLVVVGSRESGIGSRESVDEVGEMGKRRKMGKQDLTHPAHSPTPPTPISVEVAHEILIRHWSTLRWWLEENRSRLRTQRQIEQAARQWSEGGRQRDDLLRGLRLDAAAELYVHHADELSTEVQEFIEACLQAREWEQLQARRRLRRAQAAIALISVLGIGAAGFGGVAYWQQQRSRLNEIRALNALSEAQLLAHQELESVTTATQAAQLTEQMRWWGISQQTEAVVEMQTAATLQQALTETRELHRMVAHSERVNSVSVSPNGLLIASGSDDGTVQISQADGVPLRFLAVEERVMVVAFSPDGATVAIATDTGQVLLADQATATVRHTFTLNEWVTDLAWSPDGQAIAVANRTPTATLISASTGTSLATFTGHNGWVNAVQFSPDGRTLATVSEDGTARLWQSNGTPIRTFSPNAGRLSGVGFSPDGQRLAAAGEDGHVWLWNLADGAGQAFFASEEPLTGVWFSLDGRQLVSADLANHLTLWQIPEDGSPNAIQIDTIQAHGAAVLDADFTPDGQRLVTASADKTVRIWQMSPVAPAPMPVTTVAIGANGAIASAGWEGKIQMMDSNGAITTEFLAHPMPINALAFSPDGLTLAAGSDDHTITLWDMTGNQRQTFTGHEAPITSLQFSPDGRLLVSGSADQTVRIWDAATGTLLQTLTGHQDGVTTVAFSPDSNLVASGSYDNTVRLWRVADGSPVRTLEAQGLAIADLAFSPDGRTLAVASWDNTITLWRVNDGTLLHTLSGHQDGVTSLVFISDGRLLASGSGDRTIKLWDVAHGTLVKTLLGQPDSVRDLAFNPERDLLISASELEGVISWPLDLDVLLEEGRDR